VPWESLLVGRGDRLVLYRGNPDRDGERFSIVHIATDGGRGLGVDIRMRGLIFQDCTDGSELLFKGVGDGAISWEEMMRTGSQTGDGHLCEVVGGREWSDLGASNLQRKTLEKFLFHFLRIGAEK
jgi:hypothetical protein